MANDLADNRKVIWLNKNCLIISTTAIYELPTIKFDFFVSVK